MPCVKVEVTVAPLTIPPGHPVRDCGPDEDHATPEDELLIETGAGDPAGDCRIHIHPLETVGKSKEAEQTRSKSFHIIDQQVCLERVPGTGRRDGAKRCLVPMGPLHPLRTPEEKGEFFEGDRFTEIRSDTAPALNRCPEIEWRDIKGRRPGEVDNGCMEIRGEFERGLGQSFLLVAPADIMILCLLHEFLPGAGNARYIW
jgi:hypothetical protein